jgi:uncharacterized protein YggE
MFHKTIMKSKTITAALVFLFVRISSPCQTVTAIVEDKTKKIEVTGSAEMEVVPDEIYLSITLQEYYDKQKNKMDIDHIQKDFLERCTKAGIGKDRIQIQNMSGFDQSNWYWRKRRKEQPDLMASTTYVIKFSLASDIDKLQNMLDDNATQNMQITKMTHSKIEDYRQSVKIKALQAAKAKAQYLCESIGEKVGNAIYIHEVESGYAVPMYKSMQANAMMMDNSSANEGIDFQKITIRFEMQAQFAIQ